MGQVGYGRSIAWGEMPEESFCTPCFEELPKTFKQCLKMHQKHKLVPRDCPLCGNKLRVKKLKKGGVILRCTKLKLHEGLGFEAKEYSTNGRAEWQRGLAVP